MHSSFSENPQNSQTMGDIESAQEALSEIPGAAQQTSSMDAESSNPINPTSSNELEELDASQAEIVRKRTQHRHINKGDIGGLSKEIPPSLERGEWMNYMYKECPYSSQMKPYSKKVSNEKPLSDEDIQYIMQLYKASMQKALYYAATKSQKIDFSKLTTDIHRVIFESQALKASFFKQFILPFSEESRQSFLSSLPREKYPCVQKLVKAFIHHFELSFMRRLMHDSSPTLTKTSILFFKDYLDELNTTVVQEYLEILRTRDLSLKDCALIRNALLPSIVKSRHSSDISIVNTCLGLLDHRATIEEPSEAPCIDMAILSLDRPVSDLPSGHVPFTLLLRNALKQDELEKTFLTDKKIGVKLLKYLTGLTEVLDDNPLLKSWSLWIMLNYLSDFHSIKLQLFDNQIENLQRLILQQSNNGQINPISFYLYLYKQLANVYQGLQRKRIPSPSPEELLLADMKKVATATLCFTMTVYANNKASPNNPHDLYEKYQQAAKEYIDACPLPDSCSFETIEEYCHIWVQRQGGNLPTQMENKIIQQMAPTCLRHAFCGKEPLSEKDFEILDPLATLFVKIREKEAFATLLEQVAESESSNNAHNQLASKFTLGSSLLNVLAPALFYLLERGVVVSNNLATWLYSQLLGLWNAVHNYRAVAIDDNFSDDEPPIDEHPAPSCGYTNVLSLLSMPINMQQLAVGSINLYLTLRDIPPSFDKEAYQQNRAAAINYIQEYQHQLALDSVEAIKKCIFAWPEEGESLKIDDRTRPIVVNQLCSELAVINPTLAESKNLDRLLELVERIANTLTAQNAISFYLDLSQELQQLAPENTAQQTQSQPPVFTPPPSTTAPAVTASAQEVPTPTPATTTDGHGASAVTQDANSPKDHLAYKQEAHRNPKANEGNIPSSPPLNFKKELKERREAIFQKCNAQPNPSVASASGPSRPVHQNNTSALPWLECVKNDLERRRQAMTGKENPGDVTPSEASSDTEDDPQA